MKPGSTHTELLDLLARVEPVQLMSLTLLDEMLRVDPSLSPSTMIAYSPRFEVAQEELIELAQSSVSLWTKVDAIPPIPLSKNPGGF